MSRPSRNDFALAAIGLASVLALVTWVFLRYTECRAFGFSVLYCIGR